LAEFRWPRPDARHLLVSSSLMAQLEQQLFASGLPVEALMEKAALAVSRRLLEQHGAALRQSGALVLVGPGHNGGDGLVIARELHLAGIATAIWSPFERHKPLTAAHLRHGQWLGIPLLQRTPDANGPELWIDALLGIGQRRPAGKAIDALLEARQQERPQRLMAVDVPTGLCADSGRPISTHPAAAHTTYCIGLIKRGLVQDPALAWVGELERVDLGWPQALLERLLEGPHHQQPLGLAAADAGSAPWPAAAPDQGKYGRGRLLVVAGSPAYRGAAQLCLSGASASGCGSLRAAVPEPVAEGLWSVQPHVVLAAALGGHAAGGLDLGSLPAAAMERLDAVVLGPGLGPGPQPGDGSAAVEREALAWERLQQLEALLVLDADGLNRLASGGQASSWLRERRGPTWITPHAGEFSRLFPDLADRDPLDAAQAAATSSQAAVLLKGARTVIASPDGRRWQLLRACSAAARAGLGDVLAGYAAGMGAMAMAVAGSADAALLAAAALEHAEAGRRLNGAAPMAIAAALQQRIAAK
jgi:NAD(P)H-hydrate epimerase